MPEGINPLSTAQELARQGLQVLPARYKDKAPIVKWREYQSVRTERLLPTWFGTASPRNYWVMTGRISGVVVIDCDNEAAEVWWRERVDLDSAARVTTRKGHHYWFKIPADWPEDTVIPSWSVHADGLEFDVRADDTGVIAPPSMHQSGHVYRWETSLSDAGDAPAELLDGTHRGQAPSGAAGSGEGTKKDKAGNTRSMLSSLLNKPPTGEGSGRNDWLSRVAGHYARTYHNAEDLYFTHCEQANAMLAPPLGEEEYKKTVDSIWRGEHERNPERAMDATCGWLQSGGTRIMTQVVIATGPADARVREYAIEEYADFDLQAKGVMLSEDGERTYWVQIVRKRRGVGDTEVIDTVLPGHVTGDDRSLRKWLARFACTVIPPDNMWPKSGSSGVRLQRYLEAQHPPAVKVTKCLGWDGDIINGAGGFVTHDGVITADETFTCEAVGVKPDPQLKKGGMAPHVYGFDNDWDEAQRVLTEVMSFHDEHATAMFGAWWAACLVKPQIEAQTSLFPFFAIEAPSESGKTNGFFDMMTQLNGNTRGETQPTKAALRDMAAAHRNGIVWVDDLDDPTYLMELLRAATSGGTLTKMGEDRESVKNTQIVSPIVISGEALGLGSQKALLDRAVSVKVGSPTGRMSRHNNQVPQWNDVLALRAAYPDGLAGLAGWLVQEALACQERVMEALPECRGRKGRAGDKDAILRVGARLLDHLLGDKHAWEGKGRTAALVEESLLSELALGNDAQENSLTLEILPWALRTFKYPDRPMAGDTDRDLDAPVFVRRLDPALHRTRQLLLGKEDVPTVEIWFNSALLAQAFEREKHGRVSARTQTAGAFKDQADALHCPSKRYKITGGKGRLAYYRKVEGDLAEKILSRAEDQ